MLVFPAIDLLGGKAVRLEQGRRESAKVYDARAVGAGGAGSPRPAHRACTWSISTPRSRGGTRAQGQPRDHRAHRGGRRRWTSRWAAACASLDDCAALFDAGRAAAPCWARRRSRIRRWSRRRARAGRRGSWSRSTRAKARSRSRAGPRPTGADAVDIGAGGRARGRGGRALHRHRARRHARRAQPGRDRAAGAPAAAHAR